MISIKQLKLGVLFTALPLALFACGDDDVVESETPADNETNETSESSDSERVEMGENTADLLNDFNPDAPEGGNEAVMMLNMITDDVVLSKVELLDALRSSYSEEAVEYALNTVSVDWDAMALALATQYQTDLGAPAEVIKEMLTDPDTDGFSEEEADRAIAQLDPADYADMDTE